VACAEAKVTLISPFVGRILDWYKADTGKDSYRANEDPGVVSVTTIYNYFKRHGHATEVMGASFRNLGEITELAGCDLLTIAPKFLTVLAETEAELPQKLSADTATALGLARIEMSKGVFDAMHATDHMANQKLAEGIAGFSKALEELEAMLAAKL
jgi:transaldolase